MRIVSLSSLTVTAPNGGEPYDRGDPIDVTWSANAAVAKGQFGVWLVDSHNTWYIGRIVDAHGSSADYATTFAGSLTAKLPPDAYRVVVYYRASSTSAWSVYDWSDATFAIVSLSSLTVTAPNGGEPYDRGDPVDVTWSANAAVAKGQFGVWLVDSHNTWYIGRIVDAHGSSADYATTFAGSQTAKLPPDAYRVIVYYRASSTSAWSVYDWSDATFAIVSLSSLTVTAPNGGEPYDRGDPVDVTWSANAAVAKGQFGVWLVDSHNTWYIGRIVDAHGSSADYATTFAGSQTAKLPPDAYRVVVYYRASSTSAWSVYDWSDASFVIN